MDPTSQGVTLPTGFVETPRRSCLDTAKSCCVLFPIPLLGCIGLGSGGFPFILAFGGNTLGASGYVAVAWSAAVSAASFFSCGCYYKNLPERSFEKNLNRQDDANREMHTIVKGLDASTEKIHVENERLKKTVDDLKLENQLLLDQVKKTDANVVTLSLKLDTSLKQLKTDNDNAEKMQAAITDAKKIISSMVDASKAIQRNVKSSHVALKLFQDNNRTLEKHIGSLDFEKQELSELLKGYSKIVKEEHTQLATLVTTCDQFNKTCKELKKELDEFTADGKDFARNVDRDAKNTEKLEVIAGKLKELSKEINQDDNNLL
jgi:chromosome segregation ATPase